MSLVRITVSSGSQAVPGNRFGYTALPCLRRAIRRRSAYHLVSKFPLGNAPYLAKLSLATVFVPKCNLGTSEGQLGNE